MIAPIARVARQQALEVLKPSKRDLEHGLELHKNSIVFDANCAKWSYFQNSAYQIARKNSSVNPGCSADANFMSNYSTQLYPGVGPDSAETRLRLYADDHSWPNDANAWVIDYFKSWN